MVILCFSPIKNPQQKERNTMVKRKVFALMCIELRESVFPYPSGAVLDVIVW
jgi:hypothetical protein